MQAAQLVHFDPEFVLATNVAIETGRTSMDWEADYTEDGDKENFSVLVEMMAELLHEHNILFTAALSPGSYLFH